MSTEIQPKPKRTRKKLDKATADAALEHFSTAVDPFIEAGKATQWKPGVSPNPSGRPAMKEDATLTEVLAYTLGKQGARNLARALISMATDPQRPNLHAIMYIYDRLEGKPRQSVENIKQEENPFILVLKELVDEKPALAGHRVPSLPAETTFSVLKTEVREVAGEESGATV